jgi:putative endonuclease
LADLPAGRQARRTFAVFFVYVLRSQRDGALYIGLTQDVARRLQQHNRGHQRSTRVKRPFVLVLSEPFETRYAARAREKYYKSGFGREILRASFGP